MTLALPAPWHLLADGDLVLPGVKADSIGILVSRQAAAILEAQPQRTEADGTLRDLVFGTAPGRGFQDWSGLDAASALAPTDRRTVKFRDGTVVPALGQGSARLGKGRHPQAVEEEALRTGLSVGMTLLIVHK